MCKTARESPLIGHFPIHCIPQGIDTDLYAPGDRLEARALLGIPKEAQVVFISAIPNAPRKGLPYFMEALQYVKKRPRPLILVVGSRGLFPREVTDHFPMREMGYVNSSELFHTCFVASDISVLPTLADNLPLTILDSLSSGIPVISFDVGGIPEVLQTGETGYLARYKDAKDLARGIDYLLEDDSRLKKMARQGRELMLARYTLDQQAKGYAALYRQLLTLRQQASKV
jgi:glycosyltransferase involved in cell wall biosynthesis